MSKHLEIHYSGLDCFVSLSNVLDHTQYLVERFLHHGVVALLAEVVEILPREVHLL